MYPIINIVHFHSRLFHRLQCMELKKDDIENRQEQSELATKEDDSEDRQEQWSELATKVALGTLSQQNMFIYSLS